MIDRPLNDFATIGHEQILRNERSIGWQKGHELLCDGFRCGHRNPYE